MKERIKNNN